MKKTKMFSVIMAAALAVTGMGFSSLTVKADEPLVAAPLNTDAVYKMYNIVTDEVLYTTDKNEVETLEQELKWSNEGIAWYAPINGEAIYRVNYFGITHLYTEDKNEVKTLVKKYEWSADKDGEPMFYSGGNVDVYRLYNRFTGHHLLTADLEEYNSYLEQADWEGEGVKVKAYAAPDKDETPDFYDHELAPLEVPVDVKNLEDGIYNVSVDTKTVKAVDGGTSMKFTVFTPDFYDAVEVSLAKPGDVIVVSGEKIEIESIKDGEGVKYINGGLEEGGIDLKASDMGGTYYIRSYSDDTTYTKHGKVTLVVPSSVVYEDDATYIDLDGVPGTVVKVKSSKLADHLKTYHEDGLYCFNTSIEIADGKIVGFKTVYHP